MEEIHRRAIRRSRVLLVNDLNPKDIYDHLLELEVFTPLMLEYIQAQKNRIEEVQKLLDDLPKRGPNAYRKFLTALEKGGYRHLADKIRETESALQSEASANESNRNYNARINSQPPNPPTATQPLLRETPLAQPSNRETPATEPPVSKRLKQSAVTQPLGSKPTVSKPHVRQSHVTEPALKLAAKEHDEQSGGLHVIVVEPGQQGQTRTRAGNHATPNDILDNTEMPMDLGGEDELDYAAEERLLEQDTQPKVLGQDEPIIAHPEDESSSFPTSTPSIVTSSLTSKYQEHIQMDECYKMDSEHRGLALIICNQTFSPESGLEERAGADKDCKNLETLFLRLKFAVRVEKNLKAQEIKEKLLIFSKLEELRLVDSIVIVLMSHGNDQEGVYGTHGEVVTLYHILEMFSARNCPAMISKPKLFVVNACRGERIGRRGFADSVHTWSALDTRGDTGHTDTVVVNRLSSEVVQNTTPLLNQQNPVRLAANHQDFILAYSTYPGHVSYRDINEGSWFIQAIVKVFQDHCHRLHVLELLMQVNRMVASIDVGALAQTPFHNFSTTKSWYLNPDT